MILFFIALFAAGLFWFQKFLYRRFWAAGIRVEVSFQEEAVQAGEETALFEVVENRKWLPVPSLKVKFQCSRKLKFEDADNSAVTDQYYRNDLFSVMPFQRITRTHRVLCPHRGYYGISGIDLVGTDLFFSEELHGHMQSEQRIYVLPGFYESPLLQEAVRRISGEIAVRRYELTDPFTHRGIREYEPYDEMKSINWKATAKTGELKVNIREHTAVKAVRMFLNLQDRNILRREELLETGIRICARLARELLESGVQVSVYANARDCITQRPLSLEGVSGAGNLENICKMLARLDLQKPAADFEGCFGEKIFGAEALYTVFISPDRHEDFQQLLGRYKEREEFSWLCPVKEMEEGDIRDELMGSVVKILEEER